MATANIGQLGVAINGLNKSINSTSTLQNPASTPAQQAAANAALATTASNLLVIATKLANVTPVVGGAVAGGNALLTANNLKIQSDNLTNALNSGNTQAIIQASLDFGAAVAGLIAAVPNPLSPEALAIALVLSAASALYRANHPEDSRDKVNQILTPNPTTGIPQIPLGDANDNGIPDIHESAKTAADAAKATLPPRHDPLTLDLDGDGLETTGIAAINPILFDHDGDGIKNGTGWVSSDDGFLVRDKNGNGSIDSGRELFGDSTIKSNGQLATDGFDALADLDSIANGGNADGRISSADAQFTNLRVWRDLNQDGISQSNELFTLSSQNIASINVTKTANSQTLANGNQIADLGTFTKTDGTTGTAGAVTGNMADINLASDTFHCSFPNMLDTTSIAANDEEWRVRA